MVRFQNEQSRNVATILSGVMYDIPGWIRGLFVLAGLSAAVMVVVASLVGGQEQTIRVDKLLHFGGYFTLAALFVLGLRPTFYLPALLLLMLLGLAIEYLQPLNGRSRDPFDAAANLAGLTIGAAVGFVLRVLARGLRTYAKHARLRKRRQTYSRGAVILREGANVSQLFVIERGEVRLVRDLGGRRGTIGTLGPGDVFGLLGVLQSKPQYATVEAVDDVTVYGVALDDVLESAGDRGEPVSAVFNVMAKHLRALADRVVEAERTVP